MNRPLDLSGEPRAWRMVGRVLPRSIREGVYEPAYLDLWRTVAADPRRRGPWHMMLAWARVIAYFFAAFGYAIPRYFQGWGRTPLLRWTTRIAMVVVAFGVLVLLLLPRIMVQLGYYG